VNYFGHAAVASWRDGKGGLPLGAMLPDFTTMCGARVTGTSDTEVAAGIELHHTTDKVFHTAPVVTGLMRELDARLDRAGCARGPRRAVAHIGTELLLDGLLVETEAYRDAYVLGLEYEAPLLWRDPEDAERYRAFITRMRDHGVPDDLRRPEAIATRLQRTLVRRPLLAPSQRDMTVIAVALIEHKPRVEVAADSVLRILRAALVPDPLTP
jgi:hypothetical protein